MRETIQVEIDHEIVNKLTKYGEDKGWTLEETIRYILGREINITTPTLIGPSIIRPTKLTEDPATKMVASMIASQRLAKCRNCLKELTADEILDGKCSECEEKI